MTLLKHNIPELLAPAANLSCALTAYKAGADAVYAGFKAFNARSGADNFSYTDMSKLAAYAHRKGKKFYITLNTLIKDRELETLFGLITRLRALDPHAFIVQDGGLIYVLKKYFPEIPIHASTQVGIHNSGGVVMMKRAGVSRVILERQITMEELKEITSESEIETEVFIHGALCFSLSGRCLFSSWLGGHSSNRGRCKQPCRRRYHLKTGNGFYFSPSDLAALDYIEQFKNLNITSLKIEGRLKKEDYVKNTVMAYRLILDDEHSGKADVVKKARAILSRAYGRKWSDGFLFIKNAESQKNMNQRQEEALNKRFSLIDYQKPGVSGRLVGEVFNRRPPDGMRGFWMKASSPVFKYNSIRIDTGDDENTPSLTVREILVNGNSVHVLGRGQTGFISFENGFPEGKVYLVSAGRGGERSPDLEKYPLYDRGAEKKRLFVYLTIKPGIFSGSVFTDPFKKQGGVTFEKPYLLEEAESCPVTEDQVSQEFLKGVPKDAAVSEMTVNISGRFFWPHKMMKILRREFWEYVQSGLLNKHSDHHLPPRDVERKVIQKEFIRDLDVCFSQTVLSNSASLAPSDGRSPSKQNPFSLSLFFPPELKNRHPGDFLPKGNAGALVRKRIDKKEFHFVCDPQNLSDKLSVRDKYRGNSAVEILLPAFLSQFGVRAFYEKLKNILKSGMVSAFRVTSLFQIPLLKDAFSETGIKIPLFSHFPLHVSNRAAALFLAEQGFSKVQLWPELELNALACLMNSLPLRTEVYALGRIPLMVSRAPFYAEGAMSDKRKHGFFAVKTKGGKPGAVYSENVFAFDLWNSPVFKKPFDMFADLRSLHKNVKTSSFNLEHLWM